MDVGQINTPFISSRLPNWAGARQNVMGSDIFGHPVASIDGGSAQIVRSRKTVETITTEEPANLAEKPVVPAYDPMMALMVNFSVKLEDLLREIAAMRASIESLQQQVEDIQQTLDEEEIMTLEEPPELSNEIEAVLPRPPASTRPQAPPVSAAPQGGHEEGAVEEEPMGEVAEATPLPLSPAEIRGDGL